MTEMFGQLGPTVEEGRTERASPAQEENGTSILRGLRPGKCGTGEAEGEVGRHGRGSLGLISGKSARGVPRERHTELISGRG